MFIAIFSSLLLDYYILLYSWLLNLDCLLRKKKQHKNEHASDSPVA